MNTEEAQRLIQKSSHIGIVLPAFPEVDHLASAEALFILLKAQEKHAGLIMPVELSPRWVESGLFSYITGSSPLVKEFVISLDTSIDPVSELRYEKKDGELMVVLSPESSPVRPESVSFRTGKVQCDCLITLGISSKDSLKDAAGEGWESLVEQTIIAIDTNEYNDSYGTVNLLDTKKVSMCEIVRDLYEDTLKTAKHSRAATLLLLGILSKTNGLRAHTSRGVFSAFSTLIEWGADYGEAVKAFFGSIKDIEEEQVHIMGRAFVRSRIVQSASALFSFLTPDDFQKTQQTIAVLPAVFSRMRVLFPEFSFLVCIWEQEKDHGVRVAIAGDHSALQSVLKHADSEHNESYVTLRERFLQFEDAQTRVSALLGATQ